MPTGGGSGGPHYSVFRLLLISLSFSIEPYQPQLCQIPQVQLHDSKVTQNHYCQTAVTCWPAWLE